MSVFLALILPYADAQIALALPRRNRHDTHPRTQLCHIILLQLDVRLCGRRDDPAGDCKYQLACLHYLRRDERALGTVRSRSSSALKQEGSDHYARLVYCFFPETRGLELEDIDHLFDKGGITGGVWSSSGGRTVEPRRIRKDVEEVLEREADNPMKADKL